MRANYGRYRQKVVTLEFRDLAPSQRITQELGFNPVTNE